MEIGDASLKVGLPTISAIPKCQESGEPEFERYELVATNMPTVEGVTMSNLVQVDL